MPLHKLRPHHGLCAAFFCGHGYSEAFTRNMTETLVRFQQENPWITLTVGTDCICEHCPHCHAHRCDTAEQVKRYDLAVLARCGLTDGCTLHWKEFCAKVHTSILSCGKLEQICGDCAWYKICGRTDAAHLHQIFLKQCMKQSILK